MDRLFIFLQHVLPQHLLSRTVGLLARSRWAPFKNAFIGWFIRRYGIDMSEAELQQAEDYENFNHFFTRALRPGARPLAGGEDTIVSPADGVISQLGQANHQALLQAKGREFSVVELLGGSAARGEAFLHGVFATVYLAPKDYHRVHMPVRGSLQEVIHVPGRLFSVNHLTSEHVPNLFARNERVVCIFDTECGPMAVVLVGAMIVASIDTVWAGQICPRSPGSYEMDYRNHQPPIVIEKGAELGRFKAGSTVIVLFGRDRATLKAELQAGSRILMGQAMGKTGDMCSLGEDSGAGTGTGSARD